MITPPANSILLRQFREFYAEVVRRRSALLNAAPALRSDGDAGSDPVMSAWHGLHGLLQAQADEAAKRGGALSARLYREAQYVFAALADEIFLNGDAPTRNRWPLLEASLFGTQSAGETLFERIDALLERPEYVYADQAAVYFWALSLGFEGKYRGDDDLGALQQYRRRLFQLLYRDRPRLFDNELALFPQSYLHNLEDGSGRRLPNHRVWIGLLILVLVLWVGIAQLAWSHVTASIQQTVCEINPGEAGCSSP